MQQQLSLFELPPPSEAAPVWETLDKEQRALIVTRLARLMAKTLAPTLGEQSDERAEQDHL